MAEILNIENRLSSPGQDLAIKIKGTMANQSEIPEYYLKGVFGPFLAIKVGEDHSRIYTEIVAGSNYSGYHEKFPGKKIVYTSNNLEKPRRVIETIRIFEEGGGKILEKRSVAKYPWWHSNYRDYYNRFIQKDPEYILKLFTKNTRWQ